MYSFSFIEPGRLDILEKIICSLGNVKYLMFYKNKTVSFVHRLIVGQFERHRVPHRAI